MTSTKSTKTNVVATTADAVTAAKARLAKVVADPTRPESKSAARKPAAKPAAIVEPAVDVVEQSTISVDVVVVGPNLQTRTGETFHVHSPKCADRKRPVYARSDHQNSWNSIESHSSIQDLIESVEADIMRENDQVFGPGATDWKEYESEFKIYACVKGLPTAEPLTPGQLAELEAAKPARKPRTAKPAIALDQLTVLDELYYPCVMCGAEKGARCVQKSGRVKTYFHSSRTKAVELAANPKTAAVVAASDDLPAHVVVKPAAKPAAVAKPARKLAAVK